MPEYTILVVVSLVAVVLLELAWLRTGIFRRLSYWLSMLIVLGFQIPVDGWLTKLSDPIVLYDDAMTTGIRFPWDIPVEDFGFGAAMITLTMILWLHAATTDREDRRPPE
ncbi:lycopene cyclase domain-containing protein [Brachybacterium endophyticum]|uniref:Lycopene cyclase domain-containing protein n=1 Tax=Brachybacterium endophyticum TaxID=2182385 RepID=A0A2U2RKE2_9MICO|nr:lycopene cyclase domain-containing protein [Brachybacterium endophyticum]PWH06333.1 lycopene cyclase domain-containing protein [Brachybacterium endophyticum]